MVDLIVSGKSCRRMRRDVGGATTQGMYLRILWMVLIGREISMCIPFNEYEYPA